MTRVTGLVETLRGHQFLNVLQHSIIQLHDGTQKIPTLYNHDAFECVCVCEKAGSSYTAPSYTGWPRILPPHALVS